MSVRLKLSLFAVWPEMLCHEYLTNHAQYLACTGNTEEVYLLLSMVDVHSKRKHVVVSPSCINISMHVILKIYKRLTSV